MKKAVERAQLGDFHGAIGHPIRNDRMKTGQYKLESSGSISPRNEETNNKISSQANRRVESEVVDGESLRRYFR